METPAFAVTERDWMGGAGPPAAASKRKEEGETVRGTDGVTVKLTVMSWPPLLEPAAVMMMLAR